ncbi:hypothetical protein D3C86_1707240 [compost metagenome]
MPAQLPGLLAGQIERMQQATGRRVGLDAQDRLPVLLDQAAGRLFEPGDIRLAPGRRPLACWRTIGPGRQLIVGLRQRSQRQQGDQ